MPRLVHRFFPNRIWAFSRSKKHIYLTFDDGPDEEITPWILDLLDRHRAKATFFCVGENVRNHPDILKRIADEGHSIGNHTYNHVNGINTDSSFYFQNTLKAQKELEFIISKEKLLSNRVSKLLFRPPYGRIKKDQAKRIEKFGYKIVMWEIISYDYDKTVTSEECLQNVLNNVRNGSVVVFHDSKKAEKNLKYVLPKLLKDLTGKGFQFTKI